MLGCLRLVMQGTVSLQSVHGKFLSAQPDGRAEWNRDVASTWEYFHIEERQGGKITLKSAHGKYVSAQADGSVQINREAAPPGGWEEFTAELRDNGVVCLKSCHGKYLSAQQNGTAQWNRDHAPRGGWEDIRFVQRGATGQQQPATTTASMPSYVTVAQAGSPEVNGNYEFMPGKHENRHFSTIAGHYQHTQNPEIFIAFQDCGTNHQRPEWNKWMIISRAGVLYAAHTGGKIGVPPREGVWENVEAWGHSGAPGGKHPAPTVRHGEQAFKAASKIQKHIKSGRSSTSTSNEPIQVLEAVSGKPVRFKLNNPPSHNEAWVGIYPKSASDQDHGAHNQRWKYIRDIDVNNVSLANQAEGDWSIRVFSDGGYTLVERKDFFIQSTHGSRPTDATSRIREQTHVKQQEPIEIVEAVKGKPVRFKINNPPSSNDAWVGIYPSLAYDNDHGAQNKRWKWLRDIDTNNASFSKRAEGPWSIRVFSDGGFTLHARKNFHVETAKPVDPAVLESGRRSALIALFIGIVLLAPSIPLFIAGLGEGLSDGMTSATLEIKDGDGQGDLGWGIYVEASAVDFNSNGIFDHCEHIIVNATHSGSWMSDPWTGYQKVNAPDETRQVFYLETAHEGSGCNSNDGVWPESRHHDGRDLVKIGRACHGCMAGTTTITAQNTDGGEVVMWIQNEEKKEVLGMLIPGAIFMGIGGFMFIVSLFVLLNMGFKSNASSSSKRGAVVGITLFSMGLPLLIIGSTSTGEDKLAMLVPGAVMLGIGAFVTIAAAIRMGSTEGHSSVAGTGAAGGASTNIEVLSFNHNQPIRFRINNPPGGNDAWVGIYPAGAGDRDHGDRWQWLREIDVGNATLPGQAKGQWSIRVFSDGGYKLHERVDFEILEGYKDEVWMRNAQIEDSRIKGEMIDHPSFGNMNRRTSPITQRTKHGNVHRFETSSTTYLIYDEDLEDKVSNNEPFWATD